MRNKIIAIMLVAVLIIGGGLFFFLSGSDDPELVDEELSEEVVDDIPESDASSEVDQSETVEDETEEVEEQLDRDIIYTGDITGRFAVGSKSDSWYVLDSEGNILSELNLTGVSNLTGDLYPIIYYGSWGFMDKDFNKVIDYQYSDYRDMSEGLIAVQDNDKWGFINSQGEEVIPFDYDNVYGFNNGYSPVFIDGKWGVIDKDNTIIVPISYDTLVPNSGGFVHVKNEGDSEYTSYNLENGEPQKFGFYGIGRFVDNKAIVYDDETNKYGVINKNGDFIIPLEYDRIFGPAESIYHTVQGDTFSYINNNGELLFSRENEYGLSFSEGLAPFYINIEDDAQLTYVDISGNVKIEGKDMEGGLFVNGIAPIKKDKWGFINKSGQLIFPLEYDTYSNFSDDGYAIVSKGGYAELLKNNGKTLIGIDKEFEMLLKLD